MAKCGIDDADLWVELREKREEINALAQEKLLLVAKLYNLAQKFVKELEASTEETSKQMEKSTQRHGTAANQYVNEMMHYMGKIDKSGPNGPGKSQYDEQLEPTGPAQDYYGSQKSGASGSQGAKDLLTVSSKNNSRKNQTRASDGKFQSEFGGVVGAAPAQTGGSRKQNQFQSSFGEIDRKSSIQADGGAHVVGGRQKRQGQKSRGGGGDVGRHFYDASSQPANEPSL